MAGDMRSEGGNYPTAHKLFGNKGGRVVVGGGGRVWG